MAAEILELCNTVEDVLRIHAGLRSTRALRR